MMLGLVVVFVLVRIDDIGVGVGVDFGVVAVDSPIGKDGGADAVAGSGSGYGAGYG